MTYEEIWQKIKRMGQREKDRRTGLANFSFLST